MNDLDHVLVLKHGVGVTRTGDHFLIPFDRDWPFSEGKCLDQASYGEAVGYCFGFAIDRELHGSRSFDQANWRRKHRSG